MGGIIKFENYLIAHYSNFMVDDGEKIIAFVYKRYLGTPMLVTKGSGMERMFILKIANHYNIPIVKDLFLVKRLYNMDESYIPKNSWYGIIEILKKLCGENKIDFT